MYLIIHNVLSQGQRVTTLFDACTNPLIDESESQKCRIRCWKFRIRQRNFSLFQLSLLFIHVAILSLSITEVEGASQSRAGSSSQFVDENVFEIQAKSEQQFMAWGEDANKWEEGEGGEGGAVALLGDSEVQANAALLESLNAGDRPKLTLSNAILGALFGCTMFFIAFIIIISVLASIRAVDYYIFGRKDIRKELLNGEDENENGSSFWKLFSSSSSSKPSGKSAHHQANAKPQFWKAQMFHVVEMKSIRAGRKSDSQQFRTNQERLVDKTYSYNSSARAYKV